MPRSLKKGPFIDPKLAKKVESKKEIEQVATISANSDAAIGTQIAEAMERVGRDC